MSRISLIRELLTNLKGWCTFGERKCLCRLPSKEHIRHFFCNLRLLLLCRAGVDIHGGLNIPMPDPSLDILDIHALVDQDADTGGPQAVQRQIRTQVFIGADNLLEFLSDIVSAVRMSIFPGKYIIAFLVRVFEENTRRTEREQAAIIAAREQIDRFDARDADRADRTTAETDRTAGPGNRGAEDRILETHGSEREAVQKSLGRSR